MSASETAREFRLKWSHKPTPIPLAQETSELWYSETCAEQMMEAYHSSHMSEIAQRAAEKIHDMLWHMDGELDAKAIAAIIEQEGKK